MQSGPARLDSLAQFCHRRLALRIGFNLLPQGVRLRILPPKIFFDIVAMIEVKGDGRIYIRQFQGREAERDLFGWRAKLEMMQHRIQADVRVGYTNRVGLGHNEGNLESIGKIGHNCPILHHCASWLNHYLEQDMPFCRNTETLTLNSIQWWGRSRLAGQSVA